MVIGFCSTYVLMLDLDCQPKALAMKFSKKYAEVHHLGSSLLLRTSKGKYAVVFGKYLSKKEIKLHVKEARRLGMVEKSFAKMRDKVDWINIRTIAKTKKIPPPTIVAFFPNGAMEGIRDFVRFLNLTKDLSY